MRSWHLASAASAFALAPVLAVWIACRATTPGPLDRELASCIPPGTRVLAGIQLDRVRSSPVYQKVPGTALALLEPVRNASSLLLASDGKDLLWAARGNFSTMPPGASLLNPHLAIGGSPSLVQAATAQHASGRPGTLALTGQAELIASQPIWAIARRGTVLPLSGNAANVNRLLAMADYTTLGVELNSGLVLHAAGHCQSDDQAQHLEETVRGFVSLARAGARDSDLGRLLTGTQIRREGLTVHADATVSPENIQKLLNSVTAR